MDYAPGIKFTSNTQSLWMPYQLLTDYGVLAWDNSTGNSSYVTGSYSNSDDPSTDEAYALYMQNLVYWPAKLLFMSYLPSENNSNPIDLYYGRLDTAETLQVPSFHFHIDSEHAFKSIHVTDSYSIGHGTWHHFHSARPLCVHRLGGQHSGRTVGSFLLL
jgi:hypothetical protein